MSTSYAARTGKPMEECLALLTDGVDHWYTAAEAVAEGFCTTLTPALAIAASASEQTQPAYWAARKSKPTAPAVVAESPAAAAAITPEKENTMNENTSQAAAPDTAAIQASINATNRALIETGKAYAKFGGEALAMQAVTEGWTQDQLNAKLLAAASTGPAHAAYGQGARADSNENPKTQGFKSFGEFAHAVHASAVRPQSTDMRLGGASAGFQAAATTFGNESTGSEGGFAVPPEYSDRIASLITAEQSILSMCDSMPTGSNRVILPTDEDAPWAASGGIQVYWANEAGTYTASKPNLKEMQIPLHKLYAFVPMTEELLEDAPMIERYLNDKSAAKMDYAITNAIINGSGNGQPLGILKAGCLVSVAKESTQAAATIVGANILKAYARQMNPGRSVWLCNSDTLQMLLSMNIEFKSSAGAGIAAGARFPTITMPGENGNTFATIMGRPVVVTEACATLGTVGDVIFADLAGGYFAPYKAGGVQAAVSMHLYFDQGLNAFRWSFRVGGQPWLSAAVTPASGSANTKSSMVALATR
jgi:HK97 family phage major capsid protein